jgi:hypothetical protein
MGFLMDKPLLDTSQYQSHIHKYLWRDSFYLALFYSFLVYIKCNHVIVIEITNEQKSMINSAYKQYKQFSGKIGGFGKATA